MINQPGDHLVTSIRHARWEALRAAVDDLLRQRPQLLLNGRDSWLPQPIHARLSHGVQSVPIYRISSGPGRYADFDRWLPTSDRPWPIRESGFFQPPAAVMAPIDLYKVDGVYYVRDGNRRVAAARSRGQLFIPAQIIEYVVDTPLNTPAHVHAMLLVEEHSAFLDASRLSVARPDHQLACTLLGGYIDLIRHIESCRRFIEPAGDMPLPELVLAWYDLLYTPLIAVVRRHRLLAHFPDHTELDLYLWAMDRSQWNEASSLRCSSARARIWSALRTFATLRRALRTATYAVPHSAATSL